MSKKTRNVKKKISVSNNFPLPEKSRSRSSSRSNSSIKNSCHSFHADIKNEKSLSGFIEEDDLFKFYTGCDLSSEGSSWSDDLEDQSTKAVKTEYDLVQRLLYGEEAFSVYNKEFDQWTKNFKHLRVAGCGIKIPNITVPKQKVPEEIIAEHHDSEIEEIDPNYVEEVRSKVKKIVVNRILDEIRKKHIQKQSKEVKKRQTSNKTLHNSLERKPKQERSFLPIRTTALQGVQPVYQNKIMRSHNCSAKWQNSASDLRILPEITPKQSKAESNRTVVKKVSFDDKTNKRNVGNRKSRSGRKSSSQDRNVVLPPIKDHSEEFLVCQRSSSCNTARTTYSDVSSGNSRSSLSSQINAR